MWYERASCDGCVELDVQRFGRMFHRLGAPCAIPELGFAAGDDDERSATLRIAEQMPPSLTSDMG